MKIGRIPYINCYPVYGAIDRGVVTLDAELVDGVPTDLNGRMAACELDISVVSAVEYARDSERYLLLPDLAISCDGPVRSVMLFSKRPAGELTSRNVIVSRSSMTSVALLELLFENVWHSNPRFVPGDAERDSLHLACEACELEAAVRVRRLLAARCCMSRRRDAAHRLTYRSKCDLVMPVALALRSSSTALLRPIISCMLNLRRAARRCFVATLTARLSR